MFVWGCYKIYKTLMQLEFDGLDEICINVEAIPTGLKKGDGGGFI